jgi:hypothetical protein
LQFTMSTLLRSLPGSRRQGRGLTRWYAAAGSSVADPDPGSGIGCFFDPWIRDPGSRMGESQHPDPGSGMSNPDHIF